MNARIRTLALAAYVIIAGGAMGSRGSIASSASEPMDDICFTGPTALRDCQDWANSVHCPGAGWGECIDTSFTCTDLGTWLGHCVN
jgi:hypothetical protein